MAPTAMTAPATSVEIEALPESEALPTTTVELVEDCLGPNPLWNRRDAAKAAKAGRRYPVPREIVIPAGTQITHPDAWVHACPGPYNAAPKAVPVCACCKARVAEAERLRKGAIAHVRALCKMKPPKDPRARQHLKLLEEAYGPFDDDEPAETPPPPVAPPVAPPATPADKTTPGPDHVGTAGIAAGFATPIQIPAITPPADPLVAPPIAPPAAG